MDSRLIQHILGDFSQIQLTSDPGESSVLCLPVGPWVLGFCL